MGKQRRRPSASQSRHSSRPKASPRRASRRRVDVPAQWREAAAASAFDDLDRSADRPPRRVPEPLRRAQHPAAVPVRQTMVPDEHKQPDRPAHADDVRAVGYGPGDEPVVPARFALLPVRHERSGDQGQGFNPELRTPDPATVYVVDDRFVYVTDELGRVVHAEGWLGWERAADSHRRRDLAAQKLAGGTDRQSFDQGGHLIAAKFSGPGESINITAQSNTQNNAQHGTTLENNYGRLEEHWFALRVDGVAVHASIDVGYPRPSTLRPSLRTVVDRHGGGASPLRVFKERPPVRARRTAVAVDAGARVYAAAVSGVAPSGGSITAAPTRACPASRPRPAASVPRPEGRRHG